MTLDLRDLHLARPHRRDRHLSPSVRDFILGDCKFVALASPDDELTLASVGDLASDGIIEEAVLQAVNDETFETIESLANLPAFSALER